MTITALPAAPSRSDAPATFIAKADAFIAALAQFVTEANATAAALNLASVSDTSATSNLIGTGAKTFAVSAGKSFQGGMYLIIADTAAPSTNSMFCQVTSYSGTSLVVNVISILGSGTKTAWTISLATAGGATLGANTFTGLQTFKAGADIASASTVDLTAATGNVVSITGTTAVTVFTMTAGQQMVLIAAGALPLTYNATTMNINGGVSYTCAAGDRLIVVKDLANVIRVNVIKQDGTALVNPAATSTSQGIVELLIDAEYVTGTDTTRALTAAVARANNVVRSTSQASTSGTAIDFNSIPTWAKRITIMMNGVSTNGTSPLLIQIGDSGGIETTGYLGSSSNIAATVATANYTTGFGVGQDNAATQVKHGSIILENFDATTWVASGVVSRSEAAATTVLSGTKSLSATLDRVRITTVNGTDAFDAGSVNITYQ